MNTKQHDLTNTKSLQKSLQDVLVKTHDWQTCLNCIHWLKRNELCEKFGGRPPADIIVTGCIEHDDDIPF
ncbi:hypothetical protein [Xanthomonas phage XAJ2]|uniref:Uncharacterized protein n=1 Tax=Xanthomonas phage XAJ2 TaxID=1775249 RepID=A0A1I9L2K8_9CAUD|nr:hypothetical protein [Xanthomonas phage XAJ2]